MIKFVDLAAEYKSRWETAVIRPERAKDVKAVAQQLRSLKPTYDQVSAATNVKWFIVGLIHNLEASFKMTAHLHNGDPLSARTVQVPSGRPKNGSPPFSWAASAIDALTMHGMQNVGKDGWSIERISFELERYNGFGYRQSHPTVKSPYLWSCTNHYTSGKYIGDHKFSMTAVSDQVGAMAVLKQLVADGVVTLDEQANLPPPKPPQRPAAVPVPTGLFLADTQPFGLRAEPKDDAQRLLRVETDMPVRKLEDVDAVWRKVEVMAPDTSTHAGFARQDWLKPQTVLSSFVPEEFAQACLDVAARYGTNAHLLIALADAETALTNKVSPNGLYFGPYAISETEWKATNVPAETGFGDEGRFAAQLGDYAGATAKSVFAARRDAIAAPAERAGLTSLGDPVPNEGDARCPPVPLTAPWYIEHRLDEQMRYYAMGQAENEQAAARLRTISFTSAIVAAILGVAGSNFGQEWFAPWIGVMTTITVAVMAYGLLDRRQYLAATYGAMATRLSRIKEMFSEATVDLAALVTTTEDLLQAEHAAWSEQMSRVATTGTKSESGETK